MGNSIINVHPDAREALHNLYVAANLKPVLVQSEGGVAASAGTHLAAGTYVDADGHTQTYSACLDFSVNQPAIRLSDGKHIEMDELHINWFLEKASEFNFAGFHRTTSEGFPSPHLHLVCAMVEIKLPIVQHQVVDFCTGRSGLKGHAKERYFTASNANDKRIAAAFLKANPHALPEYRRALQAVVGGN